MGRKSRIETDLSAEDLAEFRRLLGSGKLTIDDLVEWLGDRGYDISRSAVGRAAQKQAAAAQRLRESRAITESLVQELGEAATQGQQGRLLVEMARSLVFDFLTQAQGGQDGEAAGLDPKDVMMLGKGLSELARAARTDQEFEEWVEARAAKLAAERAASLVEQAGPRRGLSGETIAALKADFLGVA